MENIELWIIGILFPATLISLIALKESRHFAKYWKDLYFIQKDLNEKMKKASDSNPADLKNSNSAASDVSKAIIDYFKWRKGQQLTADTLLEIETFAKEYESNL